MNTPSDEDITNMDEIISKLNFSDCVDWHGYPNNEDDILKGRILRYASSHDIGKLYKDNSGQNISLECDQRTLDFVKCGGFKKYFDDKKKEENKEAKRISTSDTNASYELMKNRLWIATFILSILANIYLILEKLGFL